MSHYDYVKGREIQTKGYPFYALIQAAMRQADTDNLELLRQAFPQVYTELQERYNRPGGLLPGDDGITTDMDDLAARREAAAVRGQGIADGTGATLQGGRGVPRPGV